jgi:hypothetical protein
MVGWWTYRIEIFLAEIRHTPVITPLTRVGRITLN